ncbi:hypothetical protein BD770DRAFT_477956 [Pilaira anomala]|nr:hypothetical protein BD770DRAFT_477956 [Pilaira anomala]
MPRLKKTQLAARRKIRNSDGKIASTGVTELEKKKEVFQEDWQIWQLDTDELLYNVENTNLSLAFQPLDVNNILRDDGSSYKKARGGNYTFNSATTMWRRQKEAEKVKPSCKLTNFGFSIIGQQEVNVEKEKEELSHTKRELLKIKSLYNILVEYTKPVMNKSHENSQVNSYNRARYMSIKLYFDFRLEGLKKIKSAEKAAKYIWPNHSKYYRHKAIIKWAKEFLNEQVLSDHCQGVHVKRVSFLSDNDVKLKVLEMIKKTKPQHRTIDKILEFIDEEIVPSLLGVTGNICATTLSNYLYEWGYAYRKNEKAIFFDGHERTDVVEYRDAWSKRMVDYMERSEFYEGEDMEKVLQPVLEDGEKKIVFVTHDESTFYANDGKREFWLKEDENYIRKKGQGSSIIVSEFQCPCHGTMRHGDKTSREYFKAGGDREGWWTYKHMVKQLKDVINLFEILHPGCIAVFLFDNSSNHSAFADDALVASRMTLKDRVWPKTEKFQFKDTTVTLSSGIKTVLTDRGQWLHDLDASMCCARHFLQKRPDFAAQKTALEETVVEAGHIFELYPKYHCECNWIEMYWGGAKREARLHCDYTFKSLEAKIPDFLDKAGDIRKIRRYFQRCMNYIDDYNYFLTPANLPQAELTIRSDLAVLGSEHKLLLFSFMWIPSSLEDDNNNNTPTFIRKRWKIKRLNEIPVHDLDTIDALTGEFYDGLYHVLDNILTQTKCVLNNGPGFGTRITSNSNLRQVYYKRWHKSIELERPSWWRNNHIIPTSDNITDDYDFDSSPFNLERIIAAVKRLPNKKSPGVDQIISEMLSPIIKIISPILNNLFRACWLTSYTPLTWHIQKAYDTVDRDVIWDQMANHSCDRLLLKLLQHFLIKSNIYINSLPQLLREPSTSTTNPNLSDINCLLFADDVALIAPPEKLQHLLDLAEEHSIQQGYRWSPSKCVILSQPPSSITTTTTVPSSSASTPTPSSTDKQYIPFTILPLLLHPPLVNTTMHIVNRIGARTNGFSVPTSIQIYKQYIRPQIEYGLCITNLINANFPALERIQDDCLRLIVGGYKNSSVKALRVMVNLPSMRDRWYSLNSRFNIRLGYLPDDSLIHKISTSNNRYSKLTLIQKKNPIYKLYTELPPDNLIIKKLPTLKPKSITKQKQLLDYWQPQWSNLLNILFLVDQICHKTQSTFAEETNQGQLFYNWLTPTKPIPTT